MATTNDTKKSAENSDISVTRTAQGVVETSTSEIARSVRPGAGVVLASELGTTTIDEGVVAKIAGLAIRDVPGVHALVPFGASQTLSSLAHSLRGSEMRDMGVNVRVGTVECAVDTRIIVSHGTSIPAVSQEIRTRVLRDVAKATGLRVKQVNIEVVDLYFDEAPARAVNTQLELA